VISSDSRAFNIDGLGLTVNNAGSILGTGNQRNGTVYADGTGDNYTFNNLAGGIIDAGAGNEGSGFGVEIGGAADGANTFTLVNAGTIQGRGNASAATSGAADGVRIGNVGNIGIAEVAISNTGLIASEGANGTVGGVRFVNGISFAGTFDNAGTITGTQNGVYFGNPVEGEGADHSNGVFNNLAGGVISSDSRAFNIDGLGLTVNNAGSILGTGNQRNGTVYADGTADAYTLNNLTGGIIDAGIGNQGSGVSLQSGVNDGDIRTVSLSNAGVIAGRGNALTSGESAGLRIFNGAGAGSTVSIDGDIINTGTISSETSAAVLIENVDLLGTFTNAGVLEGATAFDAVTALRAITFVQTGGSLNGDFVGSSQTDSVTFAQGPSTLAGSLLGDVDATLTSDAIVTVLGAQTIDGDLLADGGLNFELGTDSLSVLGDATFGADSVVTVATPDDITSLALGTPISVISETGTFTDNGVSVNIFDDDFLVDYSVVLGSVSITANAADLGAVSTDTNISAFGSAVTSAFAAGALDGNIANSLNDITGTAGFEEAAVSLLPAINESVTREVFESHSLADQFIERRLESDTRRGAWIQGFGRVANRDADTTSVTGYDASAFGLSAGVDSKVSDTLTIGAAFNYANIAIEGEGPSNEETDIDSYQVSAYAGINSGPVFVNGQAGYVFGNGQSQRTALSQSISGDFDVSGFTASATAGYQIENGSWVVTPLAGLRFASLSQDDFTETGGVNLVITSDNVQYLDAKIGADFTGNFGGGFKPFLRAAYVYDIIGDARVITADFTGANSFALSTTEPAQSRFEVNTGFGLAVGTGISLNAEYDGEFASGYQSHGGFLRARVAF
ncbi:MAG: autotransporter domain-containing protein, partial [Pseudomonadota bacterium]